MIENSLSLRISYNIRLEMWIFKTEHQTELAKFQIRCSTFKSHDNRVNKEIITTLELSV